MLLLATPLYLFLLSSARPSSPPLQVVSDKQERLLRISGAAQPGSSARAHALNGSSPMNSVASAARAAAYGEMHDSTGSVSFSANVATREGSCTAQMEGNARGPPPRRSSFSAAPGERQPVTRIRGHSPPSRGPSTTQLGGSCNDAAFEGVGAKPNAHRAPLMRLPGWSLQEASTCGSVAATDATWDSDSSLMLSADGSFASSEAPVGKGLETVFALTGARHSHCCCCCCC
jgi:hypothetical protein